jgi:hypothetical protein
VDALDQKVEQVTMATLIKQADQQSPVVLAQTHIPFILWVVQLEDLAVVQVVSLVHLVAVLMHVTT